MPRQKQVPEDGQPQSEQSSTKSTTKRLRRDSAKGVVASPQRMIQGGSRVSGLRQRPVAQRACAAR